MLRDEMKDVVGQFQKTLKYVSLVSKSGSGFAVTNLNIFLARVT